MSTSSPDIGAGFVRVLDIFAVLKSVAFDSSSVAGAPASRPAEP